MLPARITTHLPSPDLHWLVDHYQWVSIELALPEGFEERIIPTPRYSFVFQLGDPYTGRPVSRDSFREYPGALIATPVEYPVIVRPGGRTQALRVVMRPHTAELVMRTAASNMRNHVPDVADVLGEGTRELLDRMRDRADPAACIELFESWLRGHADERRARRLPEMSYAIERLAQTHGQLRIQDLATELNISERQLERWFLRSVGLGPKFFQRVVRVNAVIEQVRNAPQADWAALASQYGFSDQSHLVREFIALAGESPAAYLRNARLMREVFQQSLAARVLGDDALRERLSPRLVAHIVAARMERDEDIYRSGHEKTRLSGASADS
jgi:AraC-like DNA-binding protein